MRCSPLLTCGTKTEALLKKKSHNSCCAMLASCLPFCFLPSVFISYLIVDTDQFNNTGACSDQLSKATGE